MTLGRANSEISSSVKCDISSRTLCLLEYGCSPLKNVSPISFVEIRLCEFFRDSHFYVSDTAESARLNFFGFIKFFAVRRWTMQADESLKLNDILLFIVLFAISCTKQKKI